MNKSMASRMAISISLLALSCGGGAGSAGEFFGAYCDFFKPCCAMAKLPSDGKQCRIFFGAFGSSSSYNAQAGQACLDALKARSGNADFCINSSDEPACETVFDEMGGTAGTKAPGQTCSGNADCARSAAGKVECQSVFSGGAEIRKCQVQPRGTEGQKPCAGTVEGSTTSYVSSGDDVPAQAYLCYVADGLHCDFRSTTCVKFKAVGEMCLSSSDCARSTYCDSASENCANRKSLGAACTSSVFNTGECADGAYCGEMTKTCTGQLGNGAACTNGNQCKSTDCVNGACKGDIPANIGLSFLCGGD